MTLYLWRHWFWITTTAIFNVCNAIPSLVNLTSTEAPALSNVSNYFGIGQNQTNIPPVALPSITNVSNSTPPTAFTSLWFSNLTAYPSRQPTVIDDITDNGTLSNSSSNAINITYFNVENRTFIPSLLYPIPEREEARGNLSAAGITGITMACVSVVGIICAVSFIVYRNRGFNRPQVLNDRCSNPDSSAYIDDASIRDNSEEMYSLDNDSFLNSLEAMTIQNYWTDTVKHTKL